MSEIKEITKPDLYRLEPLLRASFGEAFDLQDELDYFDDTPHDSWFYLSDLGQPRGFIRCFEIKTDLFLAELYVAPSDSLPKYTEALLKHFREHNFLSGSAQVRFDIDESQVETLKLLAELFPTSQVKRFLYMYKVLNVAEARADDCVPSSDTFFEQTSSILGVLKYYSTDTLRTLYAEKKLYVYCETGVPVAALHIEPSSDSVCEIITLATDSTKLRRGYAEKLLEIFFVWVYPRIDKVDLKADEQNTAAINLYKKLGFEVVSGQSQQWWYVSVNA